MNRTACVAVLLLAALTSAAWAQEKPRQPPRTPLQPGVSAAGGSAQAERAFRGLDRDRDGYLSERELWDPGNRTRNWIVIDRDGDGRIAPDEFSLLTTRRPSAAAGASARR